MAVAAALWRGLAAEWAQLAPTTFPDGSPYPAAHHLDNLARIASLLTSLEWPETDALVQRMTQLMLMVRDAGRKAPDAEQTNLLFDTIGLLGERGLYWEADAVAAAGGDIERYHELTAA